MARHGVVEFLLDVSALFAAVSETHGAHQTVTLWLENVDQHASCGLTQLGTFRLLLTPAPMHGRPLKPAVAHETIARFTSLRQHRFVGCPALSGSIVGKTEGHKAATDDYLVQIASSAGCRLATLDRAVAIRWPKHTILID
jgi:predicted nucleic acid-binding protein